MEITTDKTKDENNENITSSPPQELENKAKYKDINSSIPGGTKNKTNLRYQTNLSEDVVIIRKKKDEEYNSQTNKVPHSLPWATSSKEKKLTLTIPKPIEKKKKSSTPPQKMTLVIPRQKTEGEKEKDKEMKEKFWKEKEKQLKKEKEKLKAHLNIPKKIEEVGNDGKLKSANKNNTIKYSYYVSNKSNKNSNRKVRTIEDAKIMARTLNAFDLSINAKSNPNEVNSKPRPRRKNVYS